MEKLLTGDLKDMTDEELVNWISKEFEIDKTELNQVQILVGWLDDGGWEGFAYFLLRDRETGDLYEVTAGHCSCRGFEDQWEPVITSKAYLLSENYRWRNEPEIMQFVKQLLN